MAFCNMKKWTNNITAIIFQWFYEQEILEYSVSIGQARPLQTKAGQNHNRSLYIPKTGMQIGQFHP